MAATFDAVGPGSSGASSSGSTTLTYTHTVGGGVVSGGAVVFVNVDAGADGGMTATCTFGGTSMTSLGRQETTSGAGSGFIQGFKLNPVSTGANTVTVTVSGGTPTFIVAGSLSFSGVTGFGTPVLSGTDSTYSVTVAGVASTSVVAAGLVSGNSIGAISTGTQEFINNLAGNGANATGNIAGGINTGSGSVAIGWASGGTSSARIGVEVQGTSTVNPGSPPLIGGKTWRRRHRRKPTMAFPAIPPYEGWGFPL
jgi:hypothetical protein